MRKVKEGSFEMHKCAIRKVKKNKRKRKKSMLLILSTTKLYIANKKKVINLFNYVIGQKKESDDCS